MTKHTHADIAAAHSRAKRKQAIIVLCNGLTMACDPTPFEDGTIHRSGAKAFVYTVADGTQHTFKRATLLLARTALVDWLLGDRTQAPVKTCPQCGNGVQGRKTYCGSGCRDAYGKQKRQAA